MRIAREDVARFMLDQVEQPGSTSVRRRSQVLFRVVRHFENFTLGFGHLGRLVPVSGGNSVPLPLQD
jgi:hypothetical protein